ncbi:MAG: T9SS type A sorting domain-containing protein [Bacteroidetes bacterium]|nr:T9SS type A sorting domain-containing protein [Bacteroidota bacterium]
MKCEWTTASEVNNDFFEVRRSADGQNFETIGLVDGTGSTSSYSNYNFIDAMPLQGLNYYRLRQNDFDGNFEYSEIVKVEVASEIYSVFPNPVKEKYYLKLDEADKSGMQIIQLHNALGETVLSRRVGENEKSVELDRGSFPAGSYFLSVLQDGVKRYCVRISFE